MIRFKFVRNGSTCWTVTDTVEQAWKLAYEALGAGPMSVYPA